MQAEKNSLLAYMFSKTGNMINWICGMMLGIASFTSCAEQKNKNTNMSDDITTNIKTPDTATFGTGCFWCTEAIFERLNGVVKVISGYSGGTVANPTYEEVCTGTTGHAEACTIIYDSSIISYDELLEVFWKTHDPTTLNRQGNDVGTQYRSTIFYHTQHQKELAEHYKQAINASGAYPNPVVTTIEPYTNFYSAEGYHQNYYNANPGQMYCRYVIQPKVEKFEKVFKDKIKATVEH